MPGSKQKMRWCNPRFNTYEWREVPLDDEEALELLENYAGCEHYARIYRDWRDAGASIVAALTRAGESVELGRPKKRP